MKNSERALELCKKVHSNATYLIDGKEVPYYFHCVETANIIKSQAEPDIDLDFSETLALLHDTIEDTYITYDYINKNFGKEVADGVAALTKNESLPYSSRLDDSISRIINLGSREVAVVKMADRICNLHEIPIGWGKDKCEHYLSDAVKICNALSWASKNISDALKHEIDNYNKKIKNLKK